MARGVKVSTNVKFIMRMITSARQRETVNGVKSPSHAISAASSLTNGLRKSSRAGRQAMTLSNLTKFPMNPGSAVVLSLDTHNRGSLKLDKAFLKFRTVWLKALNVIALTLEVRRTTQSAVNELARTPKTFHRNVKSCGGHVRLSPLPDVRCF